MLTAGCLAKLFSERGMRGEVSTQEGVLEGGVHGCRVFEGNNRKEHLHIRYASVINTSI